MNLDNLKREFFQNTFPILGFGIVSFVQNVFFAKTNEQFIGLEIPVAKMVVVSIMSFSPRNLRNLFHLPRSPRKSMDIEKNGLPIERCWVKKKLFPAHVLRLPRNVL